MHFNRRSTVKAFRLYFLASTFCLALATVRGQIIITNFSGLTLSDLNVLGTGGSPPDTMGCAGTNQFVQFINGAFAVYTKAGVRQSLVADSNFWVSAGISPATMAAGLSDPRIQYDAGSGRWIASEITVDATGNKILLGRSDSSNPSGTWKAVSFTSSVSGFGDFDTLGVDAQAVYLSVDIFDATGTTMTGVSLFSVPKASLLASTPTLATMTKFDSLNANTYGYALQGVNNPDAGPGHGVIVAIDNQILNQFERMTVNNPGSAGATLSTPTIIHNAYDGSPNAPAQPGGLTVDGGDDRFSAAVRQIGGYIFIANTILNTNNNRDAVHWLVLNETNNTVTSEGIITDPNYDFTYASIAASHSGKVLMGFNRIGATAPAGDISIYAALGTVVKGVVSMGAPFLLKQGTIANLDDGSGSPNRWGDYSATMFDPTDENLVWTVQEIPRTSSLWGTQITLISLNTNRPSLTITRTGSTVTLSWPLSADPAYVLESSPVLPNATWTAVTGWPQVISLNQRVVTMTLTGGALYFRLRK